MTMVAGFDGVVMVVADGGIEYDPDESKCGSLFRLDQRVLE